MNKPNIRVKVTAGAFSKQPTLRNQLLSLFPNTIFSESDEFYSDAHLIEFLSDAEAVIIGRDVINADILKALPNLKVISKYGVGVDNIDQAACDAYGVAFLSTLGSNRLCVAELTLGFMLGLTHNLAETNNKLKNGVWHKNGGIQLTGKTVGIIGVGNVGKELVRLLSPFNCTILVNDIIDQKEYYEKNNLKEATKDDIYKRSDIVTVHTPHTPLTHQMINKSVFDMMKPTALFINAARGKIVHQSDLIEALEDRIIHAAAIDVYETEPCVDMRLLSLPNLFCTPHIAGNAKEAVLAMGEAAINQLEDYFMNQS